MIAIWYLNMVEVYITISTITKKWLTRIMANLKLTISSHTYILYIYLRYSLPLRHGMSIPLFDDAQMGKKSANKAGFPEGIFKSSLKSELHIIYIRIKRYNSEIWTQPPEMGSKWDGLPSKMRQSSAENCLFGITPKLESLFWLGDFGKAGTLATGYPGCDGKLQGQFQSNC